MSTIDDRVIELQELRIGNLLEYKGYLVQVTSLSCDIDDEYEDQICFVKHGTSSNEKGGWNRSLVNDLKRIPLTPEWLDKFGFVKDYTGWHLPGTQFSLTDKFYPCWMDRMLWPQDIPDFKHLSLKYVHQMQNLFYFLTMGEELTIKEKTAGYSRASFDRA